jgi:eukaryotic-like serine/threonine-protein kinase
MGAAASADPGGSERAAEARARYRWARTKALFLSSLDHEGAQRAAFLARECGSDHDLRREVQSLLACDEAARSVCETPAGLLYANLPPLGLAAPRFATGASLGPFEIVSYLGGGGMGQVYLARDTRLARAVAIKTIHGEAGDSAAGRRLIREAQHASSLRHPHICAVYEVGESDGLPYIVMEWLEGEPLHERLRRGPLPLREALSFGRQIATAVDHAHGRGIVHRDLKSSNIIVTPDRGAVVLDFGLAKRLPAGEAPRSEPSATGLFGVEGTLSHLPPEVLLGRTADVRSDVWALGVLLYEMVSGTLPFTGRTAFETSSAILDAPIKPLPTSIPLSVRTLILNCLAKDPERRVPHAAGVAAALDDIEGRPLRAFARVALPALPLRIAILCMAASVAAALVMSGHMPLFMKRPETRVPVLAVLPFAGAMGDLAASHTAYFGAGMSDALIDELGRLQGIRVISRTSTARLQALGRTPEAIAREVGASAVLSGTVHRAGDRITADLRLLDVASGDVAWSGTLERNSRDVLVLQAAIAAELAERLHVVLRPDARERLTTVRAVNPEVYDAYLQGRAHWHQRTQGSLHAAVELFSRALTLDPSYAPAHAALADCYNQLGTVLVGGGSPSVYRPLAAASAMRALQLDPSLAEAHATLGYVRHYEWQWVEAERHLRRAIELNPNHALARIWYANLLMSRGRVDESLHQVFVARDLDPFSLVVNTNVGWMLIYARRYEDAAAHLRRTVEMDSTYVQAHQRLTDVLQLLGRYDEALEHTEASIELRDGTPASLTSLVQLHARSGRRHESERLLQEILAARRDHYVPAWSIAQLYLLLGDMETALSWMELAHAERSNGIAYLANEATDALLAHPRFQALLGLVGLDDVRAPLHQPPPDARVIP